MRPRAHFPGYRWFDSLRNSVFRTGVYTGACLSVVFTAWLLVANRVPFLVPLALERNLAGAALLLILALVPVLRFLRHPRNLLFSGLIAWAFFSFVYRLLCLFFASLNVRMGAFHLFVLGAVAYTIAATVVWISTLIWALRSHEPNSGRHLS